MPKPLPAKGYCVVDFTVMESAFLAGCRYLVGPGQLTSPRARVQAFANAAGDVRFARWLWKNIGADEYHNLIELLARSDRVGVVQVRMWPSAFPAQYGLGRFAPSREAS